MDWKVILINNEESQYEANKLGQIRNKYTKKILKGNQKSSGYIEYCIYHDEKVFYLLGHRLIAQTFLPNPNNYEVVNHIDGNKSNNTVENLEWIDYSGNNKHAWDNLLNKPHITRPVLQYDLQFNFIKRHESIAEAIKTTGAAKVREVANGERKTSGGYIWRWENDFIPEDRGKKKKVVQLNKNNEIITIFESVSEASRVTGASRTGISAVCKNKQKTCGGYGWKYLEDDIVH